MDRPNMWKLWLVGHQKGHASLELDEIYYLSARWPREERARFKAYREGRRERRMASDDVAVASPLAIAQAIRTWPTMRVEQSITQARKAAQNAEYTREEKEWIEKKLGASLRL